MLVNQVKEAIEMNRSGSVYVSKDSRSCTYDCLKEFGESLRSIAPQVVVKHLYGFGNRDIEMNLDTGEVTPMTELGWEVLECIHANDSAYQLKVNGQMAAHANSCFHGLIDVEHDHAKIRQEQRQTANDRLWAGYGSSTMGGWVE